MLLVLNNLESRLKLLVISLNPNERDFTGLGLGVMNIIRCCRLFCQKDGAWIKLNKKLFFLENDLKKKKNNN